MRLVAAALLVIFPLQIGCTTTKLHSMNVTEQQPVDVKKGQRVKVYFTDQDMEPLEGEVRETQEKYVVIRHYDNGWIDQEIPYQQIRMMEVSTKEISPQKTMVGVGAGMGIVAVGFVVLALVAVSTLPE